MHTRANESDDAFWDDIQILSCNVMYTKPSWNVDEAIDHEFTRNLCDQYYSVMAQVKIVTSET